MEEIILRTRSTGMSVLLITIAVYILAIAGRDRGRGERLCGGDDRFRCSVGYIYVGSHGAEGT